MAQSLGGENETICLKCPCTLNTHTKKEITASKMKNCSTSLSGKCVSRSREMSIKDNDTGLNGPVHGSLVVPYCRLPHTIQYGCRDSDISRSSLAGNRYWWHDGRVAYEQVRGFRGILTDVLSLQQRSRDAVKTDIYVNSCHSNLSIPFVRSIPFDTHWLKADRSFIILTWKYPRVVPYHFSQQNT